MRRVSVTTDIAAACDAVWGQLAAVGEYAAWNPFITTFRGELIVGNRIEVRIEPPGARGMTFRPTITEVEQGRRLEWLGRLVLPGMFDGRHSFHLEALDDGRTRLTQTEEFRGFLVPFMGSTLERTRAGFEAMNTALRSRAENASATVRFDPDRLPATSADGGLFGTSAEPSGDVQARPPGGRLAVLAAGGLFTVIVFQLALVLGAPFGAAAYGGAHSGQLPADLRLVSAFQAAFWSLAALTVLSRGGIRLSPVPFGISRWGTWALVGVLALGTVVNAASSSSWERFGWAPLVLGLTLTCVKLARTNAAHR